MDSQAIGNALYGLQEMNNGDPGVGPLLLALARKVSLNSTL
jgi:hypothetical protein